MRNDKLERGLEETAVDYREVLSVATGGSPGRDSNRGEAVPAIFSIPCGSINKFPAMFSIPCGSINKFRSENPLKTASMV
jgi:hypothetical protein